MNARMFLRNCRIGGGARARLLAALLVTTALIMAACGSQTGSTAGAGGTTPGAKGTASGAGKTPTPPSKAAPTITEFPLPTANSSPGGIAAGPDGNLWFTEVTCPAGAACTNGRLGRITPAGQITEFPLPNPASFPGFITAGPDGNLWFTETDNQGSNSKIGRITPAGQITEFPLPAAKSGPNGITKGPDGNLWFTEYGANKIGRITPGGQISEFPVPGGGKSSFSFPDRITAGPDGNLWFTVYTCETNLGCTTGQIGRITPAGQVTEFPLPTTGSTSEGITAGPDGNLWFTECAFPSVQTTCMQGSKVGRITPAGQITEFTPQTAGSRLGDITAGPDGNLWFTEAVGMIGRCTPGGQIAEFPVPTAHSLPRDITAGPDGNLWFTASQVSEIGRIAPGK